MTVYDSKSIERSVRERWDANNIPHSITKFNKNGRKFYLLDGPPYVNGTPHVGHVKTTAFKDVWGKFRQMQGFSVWWQPGFDCGGLPIENKVEQQLNIKLKTDIDKNVGAFIEACKAFAKGNEGVWLDTYKKIGAWRGWLEPYLTSENYYLESGWWTLKKLYEKGLLVEGTRPGFWCSHCETVLSGYEVTDSYKDLEDPSIFVKFPVNGKKNEYLLVWTTTPWTLPANVAVCVHPDETYVRVEHHDEILILAEKLLNAIEGEYKIIEKLIGKKLEGIKYNPVIECSIQKAIESDNTHQVIVSIPIMKKRVASKTRTKTGIVSNDEFGHIVDMETGSGIVHIAPGHGDVDNKIGRHYNLPEPSPVDEGGRLTEEAGQFRGVYVKKADKQIIQYLDERGLLLKSEKIVHSYPLCWRCKTPLIYRMSRQWFIKIDTLRERMMKFNKHVKWLPNFSMERFHTMLEEAPDWAVTRQRYWGITLPIWICECGTKKVIGSIKELQQNSEEDVTDYIDLHKHNVDKIHLKCACGNQMTRIPDVMDVWFDAGISPWASLGYPFKNKDLFDNLWHIDLIDESQDQIRGWFYYLMVCSAAMFDESPYDTVCLNGWTLDEKGEKMSKSLGNVVSAEDAYNELGADVLRIYTCSDISPWDTQKFSIRNAKELSRALNIFWNTYEYFKTYSRTNYDKGILSVEDKWILSRLNSLIKSTTTNLDTFNFHLACRGIIDFIVNEFSRTYIKIIRDRHDDGVDYTLTAILDNLPKIMAPFTPFISDYIYNEMFGESVHIQKWPEHDVDMIDNELENSMMLAEDITTAVNSARKDADIKLRWPIAKIVVPLAVDNDVKNILKILCNANDVVFSNEGHESLIKKTVEFGTIYIDLTVLDDASMFRELIREVQKQRKNSGLNVSQSIVLYLDDKLMKEFEEEIKQNVGAKDIIYKSQCCHIARFRDRKISFDFEVI